MAATMSKTVSSTTRQCSCAAPRSLRGPTARVRAVNGGKLNGAHTRQATLSVQPAARKAVISRALTADSPRVAEMNGKKTAQQRTVIVTGASSGLGLAAAAELAKDGNWHVIMACRDYSKAAKQARALGMNKSNYTIMHLDLACLDSVRDFVDAFRATGRPLDCLVCNAAVYLPTAKEPTYTPDGFELSVGTNHLGHFLLVNLLLEDLKKNKAEDKRCIIVGSITGNTNTLAGNIPPKADLGELQGLQQALDGKTATMIDGGEFDGAKAYKDSKVCNMLTMRQLHQRFHDSTGITFSSLYPGCIAETGLFRSHVKPFQVLFPLFQKYVTKGYVSEQEAGERLAQVVKDPSLNKSGVYWSWSREKGSFENQVSEEVADDRKGNALWDVSAKLVGLA